MKSLTKLKKRKDMVRNKCLKVLLMKNQMIRMRKEVHFQLQNQTLLPPSLQVREKETSSVLNFEGFKKEDGRINQAVNFSGQCERNPSLKI